MTRRVRLWITAVLSIAATALMVGLTVAAQAGVNHAPTHPPLAGVAFNGIDQAHRTGAAAVGGARPRACWGGFSGFSRSSAPARRCGFPACGRPVPAAMRYPSVAASASKHR
jgi:hypothetical protein